ncbi:MAG: zinc ABC transporter substrate-binding protein [Desulfocapsaceae bacterium]|nr:zinc ABC transporter substrate-binding protein [Desulfocapsaceae bacterium]
MNKKLTTGSILLLFTLFCLAPPAFSAPMEVFVSIPPQKWLSDQLGGPHVTTHVLVDKGQDPHTYEPTPKQITALCQAKIYFTLDLDFERQILPRVEKTVPNLHIIDTADAIPKITISETEQNDHHGSTNEEQHHHEGLDPHVWLSPPNLKIMAAEMARAMTSYDPANKSNYEKNLLTVIGILDKLHQNIKDELASFQGASFYVFHPAFGYFAHTYHLRQEAIETGGKSPTPRQLSALITQARANKAHVIFVQPQFDPKSAAAIAKAIDGEVVPLDPLAEDVIGNLEIMAQKLKTALSSR